MDLLLSIAAINPSVLSWRAMKFALMHELLNSSDDEYDDEDDPLNSSEQSYDDDDDDDDEPSNSSDYEDGYDDDDDDLLNSSDFDDSLNSYDDDDDISNQPENAENEIPPSSLYTSEIDIPFCSDNATSASESATNEPCGDYGGIDVDDISNSCNSGLANPGTCLHPKQVSKHEFLKLATFTNQQCQDMFRFYAHDIIYLSELLLPNKVKTSQNVTMSGAEALAITLRRLNYPNHLCDLEKEFGRHHSVLSWVYNYVVDQIATKFGCKLKDFSSHNWLTKGKLTEYAKVIAGKGAPLKNCWGFIDRIDRRICRPTENEKDYFSNDKNYHCIKFQSVCTPDGFILNLTEPYEGSRDEKDIFRDSMIHEKLKQLVKRPGRRSCTLYANKKYPYPGLLSGPYEGEKLTEKQLKFNNEMDTVRHSVEWGIDKMISLFAFVTFHHILKINLQSVPQMYKAVAILTNAHTCLYGGPTSSFFDASPADLKDYLSLK